MGLKIIIHLSHLLQNRVLFWLTIRQSPVSVLRGSAGRATPAHSTTTIRTEEDHQKTSNIGKESCNSWRKKLILECPSLLSLSPPPLSLSLSPLSFLPISPSPSLSSTPCPNVKLNDEWGDPAYCDQGHSCCYCHTRTEQQFHPEIYKSTKCNDVQQTGYCPRGPFCAFAHDESKPLMILSTIDTSGHVIFWSF